MVHTPWTVKLDLCDLLCGGKMKKLIIIVFVLFIANNVSANDDLVGSIFVCPGTYGSTYTFFPNNKYTEVNHTYGVMVEPVSYKYDGKVLTFIYIGVDRSTVTTKYNVTYLKNKGKLIIEHDEFTEICDEK